MLRQVSFTCVTFDGSPWGSGATLKQHVPRWEDRDSHEVAAYWQQVWSEAEAALRQAKIGAAESQALWEAYACFSQSLYGKKYLKRQTTPLYFVVTH